MLDKFLQGAGLDRHAIAHGLRLALAAVLAFSIASIFHVDNAFWAAMPVFVVTQPRRGLVFERAVFRIIGSIAGIAAGLGILKTGGGPWEMMALLGLWVAVNAFLVHMLRGVHGYGAMLSGISASIVVLPSLFHPETAFALAVSRAECTLIGVLCVTLVVGLFTPPSERDAFYEEVRNVAIEALRVAGLILGGNRADAAEDGLFRTMADVQRRGALVSAASPEGYRRLHHVEALLVHAMGVLGAARLVAGIQGERARAIAPLLPALAEARQDEALRQSLMAQIEEQAADLAADVRALLAADAVFDADARSADVRSFGSKATWLAPHRDERMAAFVALLAGGATGVAGYIGYLLGWPAAALAALGICTFSMIFGSMPRPKAMVPVLLKGVLSGVAMALVYRFLVQPHVETVPQLILSVAPFALFGSLVRASPKHAGWGIDLNMCFWLGSQAKLPAVTDTTTILAEAAALAFAIVFVTTAVRLLPEPVRQRARNAAQAIGRNLARIAAGPGAVPVEKIQSRSTRHFLRLALELESAIDLAERTKGGFGAVLALGRALARMHALLGEGALSAREQAVLKEALAAVADMSEPLPQLAARIAERANGLPEGEAARLLRSASAALEDSRALLNIGLGPVSA